MFWVRISIRASCTTLCDKVCQLIATGLWFSPCTPPRINWNIVESGVKHHQTNTNYRYNSALILPVQVIQRRYNGNVIFSEAGKSMKMALVALTKSFGWVSIIVTIYHSDGDNMDQTYQHIVVLVIKINISFIPDNCYWY